MAAGSGTCLAPGQLPRLTSESSFPKTGVLLLQHEFELGPCQKPPKPLANRRRPSVWKIEVLGQLGDRANFLRLAGHLGFHAAEAKLSE